MARHRPLPPIELGWPLKPVESAEHTRVERDEHGRSRFFIRHDVVRGVSPEMLVWWFNHMRGDAEVAGQRVSRYRMWHPRDHVLHEYVRPARDGRLAGPGAIFHIVEFFQGRLENRVDMYAHLERLDERGFAHHDRVAGVTVARMDYSFTRVDGGTLYENSLAVGVRSRAINRWIRRFAFPDAKGHAWSRHNIEEVGNFENFLPELYERSR
jgi:hypothetical protein